MARWCCLETGSVGNKTIGPRIVWRFRCLRLLDMTNRAVVIELRFVINGVIECSTRKTERSSQLSNYVLVFVVWKRDGELERIRAISEDESDVIAW